MHNFTIKFLVVIVLVWFRLINQHMSVNCNLNRLHNLLMRNSHPCAVNSLCMCTNNGNGTYTYKISCHEVWFYKFTGKSESAILFSHLSEDRSFVDLPSTWSHYEPHIARTHPNKPRFMLNSIETQLNLCFAQDSMFNLEDWSEHASLHQEALRHHSTCAA